VRQLAPAFFRRKLASGSGTSKVDEESGSKLPHSKA